VNSPRLACLGLAFLTLALAARAEDWAPNFTSSAVWNSNVSHADVSADQIDSLQLKTDILASQQYAFGRNDSLHLGGHLMGEWWPRYEALLGGAIGGRAEWQHKFGGHSRAPIVALEGAADAVGARETGRRGVFTGVTASVRKRLNDLTRLSLWHEVNWFDARFGTFDSAASESAIELARDLTDVTRLTFTARFRDGDVVSYASGLRPDMEALATSHRAVTTFDRPMTAYRVDARMWSGRLSFVRALDESSAIVIAYERRHAERKSLRFNEHLLSVGFVHQF
jgi:hypothetical protein